MWRFPEALGVRACALYLLQAVQGFRLQAPGNVVAGQFENVVQGEQTQFAQTFGGFCG